MDTIIERQRSVPVVREVDVLVVGGGTAGVPAALAAARLGARTMLVEKFNSFGGAITWGLTITLPPYPIVGTILNEILRRLHERYGAVVQRGPEAPTVVFDQELYKYESLLMLEEAGVEMLLNTLAVDAIVERGAVGGVIVENKSGRQAIRAKVTIDCTGDADVAFRSGAATVTAPREKLMSVTQMWVAANVDTTAPDAAEGLTCVSTGLHKGELNVWGGNLGNVDATDAWQLTGAEITLRKQSVRDWLQKRVDSPAWAESYIGFLGAHLGVRETRRLVGEYVVTAAEFGNVSYEDAVGTTTYGKQIPYRALVPCERDGLLAAGRCISTDPEVQHNIRIATDCALFGEVAGTAAAMCIKEGVEPRDVPVRTLRQQLEKQGVHFGPLDELPRSLR